MTQLLVEREPKCDLIVTIEKIVLQTKTLWGIICSVVKIGYIWCTMICVFGPSPNGKALDSDSSISRFKSLWPS